MKKFFLRIIIFAVLFAIIDCLSGILFNDMLIHAKGKDFGRMNYILNKTHEDVLIFGSSRAYHHYNPNIIGNDLNLSCYNCGQDASGILLFYPLYEVISQRYNPKCIIYEITPGFDLSIEKDNHKYLQWLKPYFGRNNSIDRTFDDIDGKERIFLHSSFYKYNSCFVQILVDYLNLLPQNKLNGYVPLNGNIKRSVIKKTAMPIVCDSLKMRYMKDFIKRASLHTKLIFIYSPLYDGSNKTQIYALKKICKQYKIPLIDMSQDPIFLGKSKYFKDAVHLNEKGSALYSKIIAEKIKINIQH